MDEDLVDLREDAVEGLVARARLELQGGRVDLGHATAGVDTDHAEGHEQGSDDLHGRLLWHLAVVR